MLVALFNVWDSLGDPLFNKTLFSWKGLILGRDGEECGCLLLCVCFRLFGGRKIERLWIVWNIQSKHSNICLFAIFGLHYAVYKDFQFIKLGMGSPKENRRYVYGL